MNTTIVALATPTGRSGIGVVRLSGDKASAITQQLLADGQFPPQPRVSHLKQIIELDTGDVVDEAIVTYFKGPASFTGEDVVEISCHGSPVVLRQVIDACLSLGARMADAGEFTLRALTNGQLDLAEAEAIRDLIDSQSKAAARQAVRQMRGEFSHELQPIKDELLDVIVLLESALEFVEDDLPETQAAAVVRRMKDLIVRVDNIAATFNAGRLIRDGLRVALVGRPNVGKSSLFNALLRADRAIVTDIAGTTRDQLHERFSIGEIPISLFDTAGLRETTDKVESLGVQRSRRAMADADIVIVMLDASDDLTAEDKQILSESGEIEHIILINKIDLVTEDQLGEFVDSVGSYKGSAHSNVVAVSAKTGVGLESLQQAIVQPFTSSDADSHGFLVTDARHNDLLLRASEEISHSLEWFEENKSEEIVLIGLHNALRYLGEITGETTTEDMLTRIFSTFCIGK